MPCPQTGLLRGNTPTSPAKKVGGVFVAVGTNERPRLQIPIFVPKRDTDAHPFVISLLRCFVSVAVYETNSKQFLLTG